MFGTNHVEPVAPDPVEVGRLLLDQSMGPIVVVDDMLDPPLWGDVPEDARNSFTDGIEDAIRKDASLENWVRDQGLMPPSSVAAPEAETYLDRLNQVLAQQPVLRALWEQHLEPQQSADRQYVSDLIRRLSALPGLLVRSGGIRVSPDIPDGLSLIFLDYTLERRDEDAAITVLKDIYAKIGDAPRPVVVLMSAGELTVAQQRKVRDATGTMPGMFHGVKKEHLSGAHLYVVLSSIAQSLSQARSLQGFSDAISSAAMTAAKKVVDIAGQLNLEDYTYVQLLSLHGDGQPLGGYVLWLLSAYFARQIALDESVRATQKPIDEMVFLSPPMETFGHSEAFVDAYQSAVFEVYGESYDDLSAEGYPGLSPEAKKQGGNPEQYVVLHFGDVFHEAPSGYVYLVATPECDLVFGGTRAYPRARHVLLIPGKLVPADQPLASGNESRLRTELFRLAESLYRIEWMLKQATTVALTDFKAWKEQGQSTRHRIARMQFAFATEVQRAYAADLTRVGSPVTPPLAQSLRASVYVTTSDQNLVCLGGPVNSAAFALYSDRFRKYVLRDALLRYVRDNLERAIEIAGQVPSREHLSYVPEEKLPEMLKNATKRARGNADQLRKLAIDLPAFLSLRGPFESNDVTEPSQASDFLTLILGQPKKGFKAVTALAVVLEPESAPTELRGTDGLSLNGTPVPTSTVTVDASLQPQPVEGKGPDNVR